jgi:hypothetical protein
MSTDLAAAVVHRVDLIKSHIVLCRPRHRCLRCRVMLAAKLACAGPDRCSIISGFRIFRCLLSSTIISSILPSCSLLLGRQSRQAYLQYFSFRSCKASFCTHPLPDLEHQIVLLFTFNHLTFSRQTCCCPRHFMPLCGSKPVQ